jgi:hypothetical protein
LTGEIKLNLNINRCFRENKRRDKLSSVFYISSGSINVHNIDADINSNNNNFLDGNDCNEYFRNNEENKGNVLYYIVKLFKSCMNFYLNYVF